LLSEKSKQNVDLQDELVRSKRVLDEKHYESGRLAEESSKKADHNLDMRDQCNDLEKEIDLLKAKKADCWREISRLKETNDLRVRESAD